MKLTRQGALQLGAYLLVVTAMMVGFVKLERLSDSRVKDRERQVQELCEEAIINRTGLRNQIMAISALGQDLVKKTPPTEKSIGSIQKFKDFELKELKKLPMIECPR